MVSGDRSPYGQKGDNMGYLKLDLQMFAGEGEEAAAPEPAAAESTAAEDIQPETPVMQGDTLGDGTKIPSARVAAALEKQMRKHPELRDVYGKPAQPAAEAQAAQEAAPAEKTIEERWEEAKKGEFADLYGQDVQNAIRDRFKNQTDANAKLNEMEPMLKVLRERAGVQSNEDLIKKVMDDDSLYEEAANEAGMTIPAYKQFMQLKAENEAAKKQAEEDQRNEMIRNHLKSLVQQGEELKKIYPAFDLQKELKDPRFVRLTGPEVNIRVEDAFYAIHHKELAPQMMQYGMQRARTQMGQTLQAQSKRPAEGAMRQQGQAAAEMKLDPSRMTRAEREQIKRQVRLGKRVSFD